MQKSKRESDLRCVLSEVTKVYCVGFLRYCLCLFVCLFVLNYSNEQGRFDVWLEVKFCWVFFCAQVEILFCERIQKNVRWQLWFQNCRQRTQIGTGTKVWCCSTLLFLVLLDFVFVCFLCFSPRTVSQVYFSFISAFKYFLKRMHVRGNGSS